MKDRLARLITAVRSDIESFTAHVRALLLSRRLNRRRKAEEKALLAAYRDLGNQAATSGAGDQRKSFGSARENREKLEELESVLANRREEADSARKLLAERGLVREGEIEALAADADRLSKLADQAKRAHTALTGSIRDIEKKLAKATGKDGEPLPIEGLTGKLEELQPALEVAGEAERESRAVADMQAGELKTEKAAWKEERDRLKGEVRTAEVAVQEAQGKVDETRVVLDGSHEDLGESVVLSGMAAPELKGAVGAAKEHLKNIEEISSSILGCREEIAGVRPGSVRFSLFAGGALLIILVAVLILSTTGGPEPAGPSEPGTQVADAPTDGPGVPQPDTPEPAPESAGGPAPENALEGFSQAMDRYYFPAAKAKGEERNRLARKAEQALQGVVDSFPESKSFLVLMEAHYYQGKCLLSLNEPAAAAAAFYSCFAFPGVPSGASEAHGAGMIGYREDAWYALLDLKEHLEPTQAMAVDRHEPIR